MAVVSIQPYDPDDGVPPAEVQAVMNAGLVEVTRRAEFYESDAVTRWYPDPMNPLVQRLVDGAVNVDYNSDERRKLDITFENTDKLLRPNPDGGFWYDKVIKVFRGVRYDPRLVEPSVAVIESEGNDPVLGMGFIAAFNQAGFRNNTLLLGETDVSNLHPYSWIVSGMATTATSVSAQLKALFALGKNIVTFGTNNGSPQLPHYTAYTIAGSPITWGIARPGSVDTPTEDVFRIPSGTDYRWTGTAGNSPSIAYDAVTGLTTRTNLVAAPDTEYMTSVMGWVDNLGFVTVDATSQLTGTKSLKSSTPSSENWGYFPMNGSTNGGSVCPNHVVGQQYTAQVKVKSVAAQTLCLMDYGDSNTSGASYTFAAGEVKVLSVTFTAGTNVFLSVRRPARASTVTTFYFDEFAIEAVGTLGIWFDGDGPYASEAATPTATGTAPTAVAAGVQTLAVWQNGASPQFITASVMRNPNGAVWIDIRLPGITGALARKFMKVLFNTVRSYYGEKTWESQLGEFYIDNISQANFPYQLKVTGRDATKKMMNSKLSRTATFVVGTRLDDFVIGQAALSGIPVSKMRMNLGDETLTTELSFDKGTSRWDMVKGALSSFNYEFFFNGMGYFVVRPFNDPTLSAIDISFGTGSNGNLVSFEKAVNDSRIYNIVQVTADPSDSADIPVSYFGEARNDDLNSPTNTTRLGERVLPIDAPWLSSDEDCAAYAADYLKISALESYELNFSSIYYPWLEAGSIIEIIDPDAYSFEPTRFLMDTIDYALGLTPMSATGKRVTFVGEAN